MKIQEFASVWDAIEDNPQDAINMRLRSDLLIDILQHIKKQKLTQKHLAQVLGISQSRVSSLVNGRIDLFGLDALTNIACCLDLNVKISTNYNLPSKDLFSPQTLMDNQISQAV